MGVTWLSGCGLPSPHSRETTRVTVLHCLSVYHVFGGAHQFHLPFFFDVFDSAKRNSARDKISLLSLMDLVAAVEKSHPRRALVAKGKEIRQQLLTVGWWVFYCAILGGGWRRFLSHPSTATFFNRIFL